MKMDNGHLLKEKSEYIRERFTTKTGLVDFFVGTAVWGFVIVNYKDIVFDYFMQLFKRIGNPLIQQYLAYLAFGVTFTVVGLVISFCIVKGFQSVVKE